MSLNSRSKEASPKTAKSPQYKRHSKSPVSRGDFSVEQRLQKVEATMNQMSFRNDHHTNST
jgi:hypothetical protein